MGNETHYIKAAELTQLIRDFYALDDQLNEWVGDKNSKDYRKIEIKRKIAIDKCGEAIYKICLGLSNHGKFSGYTWKEDMLGDALVKCSKALLNRKFDPDRGFNPFSYFNMIASHEFIHRIKVEKKHFDTVTKFGQESLREFGSDLNCPIYIKPNFASNMDELYDEDAENYEEQCEDEDEERDEFFDSDTD